MKAIKISVLAAALVVSATGLSQNSVKQRLDSLVQISGSNIIKQVLFYDAYGNDTLMLEYDNNQISNKLEQAYDVNNNMIMYAWYNWDSVSNVWIGGGTKYEYVYDANRNLTTQIAYFWNNTWVKRTKSEYTYDTNRNLTTQIDSSWNKTANKWEKPYKFEYEYDSNNNQTMRIRAFWSDTASKWINTYKEEYEYDAHRNQTMQIDYYWDYTTADWAEMGKTKSENTYDTNGNITMIVQYNWTGIWSEYQLFEYAYDANGNLIMDILKTWDNSALKWIEQKKYEYEYDNMNNRITFVSYYWVGIINLWMKSSKMEYEHNLSYNLDDLILSSWGHTYYNQIDSKTMFTGEKSYSWNATRTDWDLIYNETWYYSVPKETNIVEITKENIKIYPNPTNGKLIIAPSNSPSGGEQPTIEIFDVVGQVVFMSHLSELSPETTIDISHLANGMYFLKIDNKTIKIIKN